MPPYFLPDAAKVIIRAFGERYPELRKGSDDDRRTFTGMVASQIRFTCGPEYGTKRADRGRPVSKDSIARQPPDGGLWSWDIINGTTRDVIVDSAAEDISDQVFWPVDPVDRLRQTPAPPVVPVVDPAFVAFHAKLDGLYLKHKRALPTDDIVEAHWHNPGGLDAIDAQLTLDDPVVVPPVIVKLPEVPAAVVYDGVIHTLDGTPVGTVVLTLRARPPS